VASSNTAQSGPAFKLTASGSACGDSSCDADGGWVTECQLSMRQGSGTCHVELTFQNGKTFAEDVTMDYSGGCCPGWYPNPRFIDTSAIADAGSD
jgi:hypothetical protein